MSKEQKSKRTRIDLYNLIKDRKNIFNKNNMETKYVRVPFEVELAKKITNGECDGRIVTRDGMNARIICWDKKSGSRYSIVALLDVDTEEFIFTYTVNGFEVVDIESETDLFLEIPQNITFKDGDVLFCCGNHEWIFIYKKGKIKTDFYVALGDDGNIYFDEFLMDDREIKELRHATEEETQRMIYALKSNIDEKAKKYLERFFPKHSKSSNTGKNCEFKPFDKVLVRDNDELSWCCDIFSHKSKDGKYVCIGFYWKYCIPYNEQTAHLLGTTENY